MFVRIARFEGGTAEGIDRRLEAIKANMAEGAREAMPAGMEIKWRTTGRSRAKNTPPTSYRCTKISARRRPSGLMST